MYKVLIAEGSQMLATELGRRLSANCNVYIRQEYEDISVLAEKNRPDLVILDLMLPGVDGVAVLQNLTRLCPKPEILAVSRYISGYATEKVMRLGADYVMIKPCDAEGITARVKDMLRYRFGLEPAASPTEDAFAHARRLGVPAHLKGSKYIREAFVLLRQNPNQQITKELYPAIAAKFHVSAQRVERCMRTAIQAAWKKRDERVWGMYFASDSRGQIPKPTNGEFLACILDKTQFAA